MYACGSNEHNQLGVSVGRGKKMPLLKENNENTFKEVQFVATQETRYE